MRATKYFIIFFTSGFLTIPHISYCQKIREIEDSVYSLLLQRQIELDILHTPVPIGKGSCNLLLLNDGQDVEQLKVKLIMDSLCGAQLLKPLIVVAIKTFDRMQEYGVVGFQDYKKKGSAAKKYAEFVIDELIPYIKRKSGVKKFNSVTLSGCSLGGLSAFDISWDHADKIDKVGVFSGSFWYRDKDASDATYSDDKDRLIINKIRSSQKKPKLKYWFYAGGQEETADRDKDGIIDVIDDTKDLIDLIRNKKVCPPGDIQYTELREGTHDYHSWSKVFPQFLLWADGR